MLSKETILKGHSKFGVSINFDVICAYLKYNIFILLSKDNNFTKVSLEYISELL